MLHLNKKIINLETFKIYFTTHLPKLIIMNAHSKLFFSRPPIMNMHGIMIVYRDFFYID